VLAEAVPCRWPGRLLSRAAVYGMSRIDASGRLTSQAISHVLNWQPGDRLTLTADAGGPCATVIFTLPG
jgi:hypothetical protein